jgi:hypothetical protein
MLPRLASPPIASLYSHCLPLPDLNAAAGHHRAPYKLSRGPLRIIERAMGNAVACSRGRRGNSAMRPRGCHGGAVALKAAGEHRSAAAGATVAAYVGAGVAADHSANFSPPTAPFTEEKERDALRDREEEEGGDGRGPTPPGAAGVLHREPSSQRHRCRPSSGERWGRIGIGTK